MSNINKSKGNFQPIGVYVRLRPFNETEQRSSIIQVRNSKEIVVCANNEKKFSYDGVFGVNSSQAALYHTVVSPLIAEILSGYNCTVFAYGQTGSGKTFTMTEGISSLQPLNSLENIYLSSPNPANHYVLNAESGLIPRVLCDLFRELQALEQQYTVRCSYLEIYNEDLRDLLSIDEEQGRLRIYDDQRNKGGVIVQGIEEVTVHNTFSAMQLLQKGQERRHTASTQMNERSSRSHTIFTIIVHTREVTKDGEEIVKMGKINLVDLAGSENINRSGAVDRRAREAGNINQSLLTLGRVIKSLSEKKAHIPFRESKLTRILQDSLGGRTKTSIIATISPCATNMEETLSTLDYAHRARGITNKPETNERISQKKLLSQYVEEIARLRKDLNAAHTGKGVLLHSDNYEKLIIEQKTQKEEISKKILYIKDLKEQLKYVEEQKEIREREWIETCISFEQTRLELEKIKRMYQKTELERKEQEYLAQRYQQNAEHLHQEAKGLLSIIKSSSHNESVLGDKVTKLYEVTNANTEAVKRSCKNMQDMCHTIRTKALDLTKSSEDFNREMLESIANIQQRRLENYDKMNILKSMINSDHSDGDDLFHNLLKLNEIDLQKFKETILDCCKKCIEEVISYQEWDYKEIQSLRELLLSKEEQTKSDLLRLNQTLDSLSAVLSQSGLRNDLQVYSNNFTDDFNACLKDSHNLQSTDDCSTKLINIYQDLSAIMETELDPVESEQRKINNRYFECISLIKDQQNLLETNLSKFKQKLKRFQKKFTKSIFKAKDLTHRYIKENFDQVTEAIRKDHDHFFIQIDNANTEAQRVFNEKFNTIQSGINKSSDELFLTLSSVKTCNDDLHRKIKDLSQHFQQYNSNINDRMKQLKSSSNAISQDNFVPLILVLALSIFGLLYYHYFFQRFNYWKIRGVPYIKPTFFFGSFLTIGTGRVHPGKYLGNLYNTFPGPYFGFFAFNRPYLVAKEPEFIKTLLIKDFRHFSNRHFISDSSIDPITSNGLFNIKEPTWKWLRSKMTQFFSLGKLKLMVPLINECNKGLHDYVAKNVGKNIEAKEMCAKYTTDAITTCFFGIATNSFDAEAGFRTAGRRIMSTSLSRTLKVLSYYYAPVLVKLFRFPFVENTACEFLEKVFLQTFSKRESNNIRRNDLIDILLKLRNQDAECNGFKFTDKNMVAQAITFFSAGVESSASALAFTLHELCVHKEIQERVRKEIQDTVAKRGKVSYEAIQDMKYLNMVVDVPDTGLTIEKGTPIVISIYGLHYNEKYFPNPFKFDPERFNEDNIGRIENCTYLAFGDGPRNCIGPYFGFFAFNRPYLVAKEPEFIKTLLIKDFRHFSNRHFISDSSIDPITSNGLFNIKEPTWKWLRSKMTQFFSLGKLKLMVPLINECNKGLHDYVAKNVGKNIEAKEMCAKYTTDAITTCFFGIATNSFDAEAGFRTAGRRIMSTSLSRTLKVLSYYYAPVLVKLFRFPFVENTACEFLEKVFLQTFSKRESNNIRRNDLIDILLKLRNQDAECNGFKFTDKNMVAQAITFFSAGVESSASALAFTLHELCVHKEIQERVRKEIQDTVAKRGKVSYEAIQEMKYLNMVVDVPDTGLTIEKGTPIVISIYGLHYNEKYFSNPFKFDPERFNEDNIGHIENCTYLAFGDGPRNCIGQMLTHIITKMGVIEILRNFSIERNAKTREPVVLHPFPIIVADGGLPLTFKYLPK
ncbi:hypothetical protein RN001_007368 [Aquatica leii]|uniref:Kinesin motor domain-containing protein n=1 Tax=Aquatica leii TaxID=1421715 RepID=A0AAN7P879_9COLE|nr:hypothetical protein RN001_007368 [Aquatica leii]